MVSKKKKDRPREEMPGELSETPREDEAIGAAPGPANDPAGAATAPAEGDVEPVAESQSADQVIEALSAEYDTRLVRLHDASRYGLSIVCRERLFPREVIELRLLDGDDLHDRFRVVHITEHACEMRIGMIAEC
jgi:hypothetical protein